VSPLVGGGSEIFNSPIPVPGSVANHGVSMVALGDLNGDGRVDIFGTVGEVPGVLLSDGARTFTPTGQQFDAGWIPAVALGDGDGDLDAVFARYGGSEV
jgi:hypothetical protein